MQDCVTGSFPIATGDAGRSNRAGDSELCCMWQDVHAFTPTRHVRPDVRIRRNLVRRGLMNIVRPPGQRIDLSLHHARRIVASQAHLRVRAVAHQKVLRNPVDALHVRIMATGALDIAVDQLHRASRIGRLALGRQRCRQIRRIFQRRDQTEGMRPGQCRAERIGALQLSRLSATGRRPPTAPRPPCRRDNSGTGCWSRPASAACCPARDRSCCCRECMSSAKASGSTAGSCRPIRCAEHGRTCSPGFPANRPTRHWPAVRLCGPSTSGFTCAIATPASNSTHTKDRIAFTVASRPPPSPTRSSETPAPGD